MLKNLARLEHVVEDKVVHLLCDNDTPLTVIKDALFQFSKYIGKIEDTVKEQQEKAKAEKDAKEKEQPEVIEAIAE